VRGEIDVSSCTRSTSRWRVVPLESESEPHRGDIPQGRDVDVWSILFYCITV
jgi:hypothetical protein